METGTMDSGTTGQKTTGQRTMRLWGTRGFDNGALRHLDRTVDNERMDSGTIRPWDGGAVDDGTINNGTLGYSRKNDPGGTRAQPLSTGGHTTLPPCGVPQKLCATYHNPSDK